MAVMDFREGGSGFTLSRQRARRDQTFDERGWYDTPAAENGYPDPNGYPADMAAQSLGSRIGRLTHYLGAMVSVGLMVGLMIWGWQLVMRDVSGVPVIKALAGDARSAPEEPGGELTSYTGYAVNDVTEGAADQQSAQVAIAPDATGLTDSDVAMGQLGATAREPQAPSEQSVSFDEDAVLAVSDAEARAAEDAARLVAEQTRAAMQMAAADAAVSTVDGSDAPALEGPVNAAVLDENGQPAQAAAINDALASAQRTEATLIASVRPAPRPRRADPAATETNRAAATTTASEAAPAARPQAQEVAAADSAAPAPRPAAEPEVADAAPAAAPSSGAPLVQIGAFDSDAIAASEFGRVSGKFGNLFAGKGQVIQQHQSNGRTFWRLRVAGFETRAEAQKFCAELIAAGTDCIPATAQ